MKQLALFVATSFALGASAFNIPVIPLNWTTQYACAVDVPSRVLANVVTTQYTDNTPGSCVQRCDAAGYTWAGVEYSNECHCGTGLVGTPASAPVSDCNMACTGDPNLSCGGSWRIQIYKSPDLGPGSWTLRGCYLDTAASPAFGSPLVHHTFDTNLDLITQCVDYCGHLGYPWSGVENATDCQCSFGLTPGAQLRPQSECNSLCPLPPGEGNEYCGGFQRLEVYQFQNHT
ncbi:WSC-domain-containing protein [Multifurca ochricompacta]|uniref:WSC-domain-containing protein n=1 Tax=Multifurca ochricompacta TaxID=376703 RepID=A0AAD4QL69_9AGAM|nr:WSC-domain-containing protein [Multifurca ochricompacta]KAI0295879.1 WSC-domain-containing protein [Multifurca ochricompacta]